MDGEGEADDGGENEKNTAAREGKDGEQEIAGDADGGDGNLVNHRKGAVVDDAAVPVLIDGTGLGAGVVMDFEGERRVDDAGQGDEEDEETHHLKILSNEAGFWRAARMNA